MYTPGWLYVHHFHAETIKGQRVSDSLELGVQEIVAHNIDIDAGSQTQALRKRS